MNALPTELRKRLEKAIRDARGKAEEGARKALEALAVGRHEPHGSMDANARALRTKLRAHGRQLGDLLDKQKGAQETRRLEREVAYEHWHRMLFARFLAENGLLLEPNHAVPVTLEECGELARDASRDPWELAASYAERMLPRIFRADDPVLAVTLPPETRQALQRLVAELPTAVFTADDALGWTYQFWQAAEKDAVNARVKSGEKITGETLPAVTQLFTEPYMVQFLLHNTIGAWHAGKILAERSELAAEARSEQELREAVALPGYAFEYLRFVRTPREGEDPNAGTGPWRPAAGSYPTWPKRSQELTVLDPCCGSGHFLVAAFDLLVRLRRAEEGLDLERAIRAVLEGNLFGLELDPRCTQIAAFHLALAAWRLAGRAIELPPLQIACSGIGPHATKEEWNRLAEEVVETWPHETTAEKARACIGLERLYDIFELAPELGSLIDPASGEADVFATGTERLLPLLEAALVAETTGEEAHERAVAAQGMAQAARILMGPTAGYTLVITNVPYLGRGSQSELLREFAEDQYPEAKADLATIFVARMLRWVKRAGTVAAVTPQNWLFLTSYKKLRKQLLDDRTWEIVARLGAGAFETIGGEVVNVALLSISGGAANKNHLMAGLDVSARRGQPPILATEKAALLRGEFLSASPNAVAPPSDPSDPESDEREVLLNEDAAADGLVRLAHQSDQLLNPAVHISFRPRSGERLSGEFARAYQGLKTGDDDRFRRSWWEIEGMPTRWLFYQSTVDSTAHWSGLIYRVDALDGDRQWARPQGKGAWGRSGVAISQMSQLPVALYTGAIFDSNMSALVPELGEDLLALWCMCSDLSFCSRVRAFDQSLKVPNGSFERVPFDSDHWRSVAAERYPYGLPEPQSADPTQWLFHGHPAHAESATALQVAVARLFGYRWPAELDESMRLAPEARALVRRCAELAPHADRDGIVCLASVQGEGSAADRVRSLLAAAFGPEWSAAKEEDLLCSAGERFARGKVQPSLEEWLRDRFFEEHCALFHGRPFVWHIWDGQPQGFHALVNYHRLAGPDGEGRRTLEKLASTYLGEWIERQRQLVAAQQEGADGRLAAALALQAELRKILQGEPPYDLFVRWKPLHDQPLGWDPDINDGVRLNIRPFLRAKDVGKKGAGVLRAKPDNTWSDAKKLGVKDRGKEPESLRPRHLFPWFWGCDPEKHAEHRNDFGAGTPGAVPAGKVFTGERWNGLHYSRVAREAARRDLQS
ncbi:MAG: N-6 DNA methylase [Planctomycetes bacterium]|nr:N-6 DNA methylase [Planctomycetota bacterium]